MIYTSYLGNLKNLDKDKKKVSIMRFTPEWAEPLVDEIRLELAPKAKDLQEFKDKIIDEEEYTKRYLKQIERVPIKTIINELDNKILLCICKLGHFCHRHILVNYLRDKKVDINEVTTQDSLKDIKVELIDKLTVKECNKNPNKIYVFGDNLEGYGKKGQAIIRDCPNAFGIPTKRKPFMNQDAFFRDTISDKLAVSRALVKLRLLAYNGKTIVFPSNGIGTGLADMGNTSPSLFIWMNNFIDNNFLKFKGKTITKTRIIVAGSRKINDYELIAKTLDEYLKDKKNPVIVSGLAKGPDKLGLRYAKANKLEYEAHAADWDKYGKSAGYKRNLEMAEGSDELLAFWDGVSPGTEHMINIAKKEKIKVKVIVVK